ncbi:MAG: hypothetical protein KAT06_03105 [Gammaproteobacteria bacterium]|nr:hypothetical protein [Gammaproteobacteria bacterium]
MLAINVQNTRLKEFVKDVDSGLVLYMVDVAVNRIDEISNLEYSNNPEVTNKGIDHTIPAFP